MSDDKVIVDWRKALLSSRGILNDYTSNYFQVGGRFDRIVVIAVWLSSLVGLLVIVWLTNPAAFCERSFEDIKALSAILQGIAVGVLGFLIAAFAIFMSTTSKTLLIQLSKMRHKKTGLSQFRFILVSYMSIFVDFIGLLIISAVAELFTTDNGLLQLLAAKIFKLSVFSAACGDALVTASLLAFATQAVFQLKSFLTNLYQSLVLYVATLPET